MLAITVQHNDVELALRLLKRQLQKSGPHSPGLS